MQGKSMYVLAVLGTDDEQTQKTQPTVFACIKQHLADTSVNPEIKEPALIRGADKLSPLFRYQACF